MKTNGWQIGLASSTLHDTIKDELEFLGMYKFFDQIVSGEMVRESKPHPEIFFKACELMGCKPEEAYAVEDSKNGVRAAAMAGLKVILVPDVIPPDDDMERLCWNKFPDLSEVRRYFNTKDLEA
ncbi:MAG: HAD-IA family hydrolase [Eubacterium sp.]|nr:HAD-IA family hydrolase [Eubacterium sp.]